MRALLLSLPLALLACSDGSETVGDGDGDDSTSGGAPSSGHGDTGESETGGSSSGGTDAGAGGGAATSTGGAAPSSGGSDVGAGGTGAAAGGSNSSGGTDTGAGGSDGSGGSAPKPDAMAVASIAGWGDNPLSGTATFTQIDGMVTLVVELENCPTKEGNPHGSHLHQENDCGNDGNDAGGHWSQGELIGDITCVDGTTVHEITRSTDKWTIGGSESTDVTRHAIMIHSGATGPRIACGEVAIVAVD